MVITALMTNLTLPAIITIADRRALTALLVAHLIPVAPEDQTDLVGNPANRGNDDACLMIAFINLLHGMSNQVNNPSLWPVHTKVKEPDVFDGLDLQKLKAFIVSFQLNFNNRPNAFCMEASKVNYAISFLSSMALDWFEPDILHPNHTNPPAWAYSYATFLLELRTNFGPFYAIRDAEDELKNLHMHDGDWIMKYIVRFNQHAAVIGYGDNSLCYAFYHGLCTQIKDDMAHHGKPNNLHDM